ncbi:hypothetical protein [Streptomyces sp. NPDC059247]|uniref:hypothetical protein n=1 Tax=Streptomyces sp. NPDC059247 TaxID=3346790 RepID=UPI0036D1EC81
MDTSAGTGRYGKIVRLDHGLYVLRPPGGGAEWAASEHSLREPTLDEASDIRTLTTPVPTDRP